MEIRKTFFKKYLFTFDLDGKTLGFYNQNISINNEYDDINNYEIKYIIIIILILLLISFFLYYLLAKNIYGNKNIVVEDKIVTELMAINHEPLLNIYGYIYKYRLYNVQYYYLFLFKKLFVIKPFVESNNNK